MKTKLFTFIIISILFFSIFSLTSCENSLALGNRLNLSPPEVTIINPESMKNISDEILVIEGTASDLEEVTHIIVSIESTEADWKIEWLGYLGEWSLRSTSISNYKGYTASWEGNKTNVTWSISTYITDAPEGEFVISANAVNSVGNEGAKEQRHVTIDLKKPVVNILIPELYSLENPFDTESDSVFYLKKLFKDSDGNPLPPERVLRNPANLDKFHCDTINIQYEIKDDFSIDTITVILKDDSGTEYFRNFNPNASWNGSIPINKDDFNPPLPDTHTFLQIVTVATDKAGNPDNNEEKAHDWLIWWPEAAKPWAEGLGSADKFKSRNVYPGSQVYGSAYGKYEIESVSYKVFAELNLNLFDDDYDYIDANNEKAVITGIRTNEFSSTFFNFDFTFDNPSTPTYYAIRTTTKDRMGNETDDLFFAFSEEMTGLGPLMLSYDVSPSGTYGIGSKITITINFREAVLAQDTPSLTLNIENGANKEKTIPLASGNGTNQHTFEYTVAENDHTELLSIERFNNYEPFNITKPNGQPLQSPVYIGVDGPEYGGLPPLSSYSSIIIQTDSPVLIAGSGSPGTGVYYNQATSLLTLTFSKSVFKGTGIITIAHEDTDTNPYLAPAVLTKAEYEKYGGDALKYYYTRTTNGASADGRIDTTEKFVLNYSIDPARNGTLENLLKEKGADKIIIDVKSSAVTVTGSTMVVDLSAARGNAPSVKGVQYSVSYPAGIVQDSQSNPAPALAATERKFLVPGVNQPFIRVRRDKETIQTSGNVANPNFIYRWNRTVIDDEDITEVKALDVGDTESSEWTQLGGVSIGIQERGIIGYRQATAPTGEYEGTYINLRDINYGETTGNGRIQGAAFFRSQEPISGNSYYYSVHWGVYSGNTPTWNDVQYTLLVETANNEGQALTAAIKTLTGEDDENIWVSYVENKEITAFAFDGDISGRSGVWLYNVWGKGDITITPETVDSHTRPEGDGWIRGELLNIEISNTPRTFANMTAVQPVTTEYKIDCQTPDATIKYTVKETEESFFAGPFNNGNHTNPIENMSGKMPADPTESTVNPISRSLGQSNLNGFVYGIKAKAWKDGAESDIAHEVAVRSVIIFNNITEARWWSWTDWGGGPFGDSELLINQISGTEKLQLWIRGGDDPEGGRNSTPGFPFSWITSDNSGARLMTSPGDESDNQGAWYWVSWNVTVPAYFQFLAGVTPTTTGLEDIRDNGPLRWSWSKNFWALQKREFVLYPGNSLLFTRNTVVSTPATSVFEFYDTFTNRK